MRKIVADTADQRVAAQAAIDQVVAVTPVECVRTAGARDRVPLAGAGDRISQAGAVERNDVSRRPGDERQPRQIDALAIDNERIERCGIADHQTDPA